MRQKFIFKASLFFLLALLLCSNIYAQVKIGEKAPKIFLDEIYNSNSSEIPSVESLENNVVVLYFWATWCKPCVSSFPKINELYKKYEKDNVKIIAITDDPKEKLENFLNKANVTFLIGRDNSEKSFANYNVSGRPTVYIINNQGVVVYQGRTITEELIEEVLATNDIEVSQDPITDGVMTFVGFSPGEDPLYNAIYIMHYKREDYRWDYNLIEQFIIRPSLETKFWGCGWKFHQGYVGVTYSGGDLADIFTFLHEKSSKNWIKNNTQDTNLYDIVYWRKAKNRKQAYKEIEQKLSNGLSFNVNTVIMEQDVNMLYVSHKNDSLKKEEEVSWETMNIYMGIDNVISCLEKKSGQYFMADNSAKNILIYNNEMDWEKLTMATTEDLIDFLKRRGIDIRVEKRKIKLLELNKK